MRYLHILGKGYIYILAYVHGKNVHPEWHKVICNHQFYATRNFEKSPLGSCQFRVHWRLRTEAVLRIDLIYSSWAVLRGLRAFETLYMLHSTLTVTTPWAQLLITRPSNPECLWNLPSLSYKKNVSTVPLHVSHRQVGSESKMWDLSRRRTSYPEIHLISRDYYLSSNQRACITHRYTYGTPTTNLV